MIDDDNGDDDDGSLSEAALTLLSLQRSCRLVEMKILPALTLIYDVCVCVGHVCGLWQLRSGSRGQTAGLFSVWTVLSSLLCKR